MRVYYHQHCALHNPPYEFLSGKVVPYYESPDRIRRIRLELEQNPALFQFVDAQDAEIEVQKYILTVHSAEYIHYLETAYEKWVSAGGDETAVFPETFAHPGLLLVNPEKPEELNIIAQAGLFCFDQSCPITADTYPSILASARVVLAAAQMLVSSTDEHGTFALTRPPGHHAGSSLCGGYCFLNNIAMAARYIQSSVDSAEDTKIAILDIDYHHGNGTQAIFYSDPTVMYVSLHAEHDYPYFTGSITERGSNEGEGFTLNFPLPRVFTGNDEYCAALQRAISHINNFQPSYLLVSLGVDTYLEDPLCEFGVTTPGYRRIGEIISRTEAPTLFVMEGGYHLETLGANVRGVLEGFEEARSTLEVGIF